MKNNELTFPTTNLQFFAESTSIDSNTDNQPDNESDSSKGSDSANDSETKLSAEEQLQQMRVEMAKMKKSFDKAASEAADYKKKYNATLDESERKKQEEAEQQAEREAKYEQLLKENTVTKFEKNYLSLGYPEELATKAANAQYDNDTDALFKIQNDFQAILKKNMEAEWLKNRPATKSGVGEETTVSKEQFNKMGYLQRVEFAEKYPETYKEYTK